ncbi:glycine-rich RNA-binding protein RZ1C-like [Lycium barbarum]|uniref:glycine-rich RNA-binding protein RZ1C-like n=1 Tax=Lycium barbarum TaxID=112863 RepID=UPI00293F6604|nr:glycine-rich RNA-binding protein RZ1C-like [Lycium barbarum]
MVIDMGDRVQQFVNGLGPHLIDDFLTDSLQKGMDISRIQAHAQNLEERQQQRKSERDYDRGYSKRARFSGAISDFREGQRQQYFRHSVQSVASEPSRFAGQCNLGSDACYACGQTGHMMRNCPSRGGRGMSQPMGSAVGSSSSVRSMKQGL